ncbi:YraN family protein [uncultured Christiangramia sp.]|uniref:YraN family protein n=1 Tax=Christiangramia sp. 3-2217-3z TaxID=3417564 RepID=UPI002622E8C2|nr:YraN family protein [uncultured Christiangramia sp.]
MATHNDLGKKGEELAVQFLLKNNYEILERNFRYRKAEVDIIAREADTLIAVEVKSRSSVYFGNPEDFVKPAQIKLLVEAINHYSEKQNTDLEIRFDIIAITKSGSNYDIEHITDAFLHF